MRNCVLNKCVKKSFAYLGSDHNNKFLITGANGLIGNNLAKALYRRYGMSNVIVSDISDPIKETEGKFYKLDVTNIEKYREIVKENKVNHILHLANINSIECEKNINQGMKVNIQGVDNSLNIATETNSLIFIPSTIGLKFEENNLNHFNPETFYEISKMYMEKLGNYYYKKYATNFRCLRYPSIISPNEPSTVTTYATYPSELIHAFLNKKEHTIYLDPDIQSQIMYMSDCIRGTIEFVEAGNSNLSRRAYNFNGLSISPRLFLKELKKSIKFDDSTLTYNIDHIRNEMLKSLQKSSDYDDKLSNKDWGWKPQILNTKKLVEALITDISEFYRT